SCSKRASRTIIGMTVAHLVGTGRASLPVPTPIFDMTRDSQPFRLSDQVFAGPQALGAGIILSYRHPWTTALRRHNVIGAIVLRLILIHAETVVHAHFRRRRHRNHS